MTQPTASAALRAWLAAQQFARIDGHRIAYRRSDPASTARPTLILIHGFPTAGYDWHAVWDGLVGHFDLLAPDLLGFGASDKPVRHDYRLTGQASIVAALARDLRIRHAHVLAHDYGDSVAQELLALATLDGAGRGDALAIDSLVFLNGGLFPEAHRARPIQTALASPLGGLLARLLNRGRYARSLAAVFAPDHSPSPELLDDFWLLTAANNGHRIAHRLLQYLAERRRQRERWVTAMQTTTVPLRFINGSVDPISGAHMAARYRELIPRPDVVELPGVGHYPQVEAPDEVLRACLEFFKKGPE